MKTDLIHTGWIIVIDDSSYLEMIMNVRVP